VRRSVPRVRWQKFGTGQLSSVRSVVSAPGRNLEFSAQRNETASILAQVGVPLLEGAQTAQQHAIGLLQIAAEVEQALMVQYLYAATSAVSAPDAPEDYQKKLIRIAVEEMGHLATVQNLLLLVGGPDALHLQRDEIRKNSDENPIPFILQPITRVTLAEYVAAEMPATVPPVRKALVDELMALAGSATHMKLHRVGAIYAVLEWMFLPKKEARAWIDLPSLVSLPKNPHITSADLRPLEEVQQYEAQAEEWQVFRPDIILATPHDANEAVQAIRRIAAQGEGFDDSGQSHFQQFLGVVDALDQQKLSSIALAVSPSLGTGNGGERGEPISHPYTRLWGEVFSQQYGALVLCIYHALRIPRQDDASAMRRGSVAALAVEGMKTIIRSLCPLFADLPLRSNDMALAGPPFDLDPSLLQLAPEEELTERHLTTLEKLSILYKSIEKAPEFNSFPQHKNTLDNLRTFDEQARELFSVPTV
jgi:hypothetical protein